jgi:drug/metabolite transporter (DMT)-like permease
MLNKYKAHIALIIANVFFGINFPIAKGLMPKYLHPIEIIVLRASITALLFWIISLLFVKEKTEKKDFFILALCGLFGVSINQLLFFEGLNLSTTIDASIIMAIIPVMVLIISIFLIKEKLTIAKSIGIILGAAGAIITIVYGKKLSTGSDQITGNLFLFINALSYSIYFVMVKPLMEKYNSFTVMKWTFLFGFIFIIPFSTRAFTNVNWDAFSGYTWSALVYVIVATTFLAYLLIAYSMKFVNSSVASFYIYLQPVVASILAMVMYDEKLTAMKIASTLMIFTGVYLVSKKFPVKKSA